MNKINDHVSLESIITKEIGWHNNRSGQEPVKMSPVNITLSFDHGTKINELADPDSRFGYIRVLFDRRL